MMNPINAPDSDPVSVRIHRNQFPEQVEAALCESLRSRRMNHKFHYDTPRQALQWLRVHEAFSPARTDASCRQAYERAAHAVAADLAGQKELELISLGCGGGQKEAQLIQVLRNSNPALRIHFVPVDASVGLALTSRDAAVDAGLRGADCDPLVMDLASAEDWEAALSTVLEPAQRRVITFLGMLPNFLPGTALPQLARLARRDDCLLLSANLVPEADYVAGVERILPLYDNQLTRDWLLTVLLDLGVERSDGTLEFSIVPCPEQSGLLRVQADFAFKSARAIGYAGRDWQFEPGERFQLFFSYRHSVKRMTDQCRQEGIQIASHWLNQDESEGVFVGKKAGIRRSEEK